MASVPAVSEWQNKANVLAYAYQNRTGYMRDLHAVDKRKGEAVESLKSVGFIKTGYTADAQTYGLTNLGRQYFEDFLIDKVSLTKSKARQKKPSIFKRVLKKLFRCK